MVSQRDRFSLPDPDSPAKKLLSGASHLKIELSRIAGQLVLSTELQSEICSAEHARDDDGGIACLADGSTADDAELLELAGSLVRSFAAASGKRGAK